MLDKRLKKCAELVSGFGVACDVGTDHAYLAAELIKSGKCKKVIASDVKEGPLEAAKKTVEKYGVADKVELILSNGLEKISSKNVTDIVIAGMGGETIVDILAECEWVYSEEVSLILQPMTKPEVLRSFLGAMGFNILEEHAVEDGDRIYIVILAEFDGTGFAASELRCMKGFLDDTDPVVRKYLANQCRSLQKKAAALDEAGKKESALHYRTLAAQLLNDYDSVPLADIYNYLDSVFPFATQEKWDNSGLLVDTTREVSTVMLSLDITSEVVDEAALYGAELIISHHPVIFEPLRSISIESPVYRLINNHISAICAHTNVDKSPEGTNGVILKKLKEHFELEDNVELFEECGDGLGFGYIVELKNPMDVVEFAKEIKKVFGCKYIRTSRMTLRNIKRVAFCSGSGGSMLETALAKNCDVYITGDVKHDVWIEANNGFEPVLFDCGHFHTENPVLENIRYLLEQKFPQLEVIIAERSEDPCSYV